MCVPSTDHIGSHMGEKKVLCPICGKYVMDKWKATHQRSHEEKQVWGEAPASLSFLTDRESCCAA